MIKTGRFLSPRRLAAVFACLVLGTSLFSLPNVLAVPSGSRPSANPTPAATTPKPNEMRLTEEDNGRLAELGEDQTLVISLESNPSTGYSWEVAEINKDLLHQVGKAEFKQTSPLLGASEKQILRFKPLGAGQSTLKLVYRRPWEKDVEPAKKFSVQVVGSPDIVPEKEPMKPAVEQFMRLELPKQRPSIEPEARESEPGTSGEIELQGRLGTWTNIMTEYFEEGFPEAAWSLYENPTWDDTSYRDYSGSWSGYCAKGGSNGVNPPGPYTNNMAAWMVYGPFDLSDATDAELQFYHWTKTQAPYDNHVYDYLFVGASIDGSTFYGNAYSGDLVSQCGGWCQTDFDLTDVYMLGNLCGYHDVWIAFEFKSNSSITDEGTYLDDIVLRKVTGQPTTPTPTPTQGDVTPTPTSTPGTSGSLPAAFDWRDQGGVTSVKNQGTCGSCWAFSTVGPLEANIKIEDGVEEDLAEQYLLSCNTEGWNCTDGGWWAHDYHEWKKPPSESEAGAVFEAYSPYVGYDAACQGPYPHSYQIDSWHFVGSQYGVPPVEDIKQAIYDHGPVSAAVCVGSAFQGYDPDYGSPIVFETNETCSPYSTNHAIVLVGWDDDYYGDGSNVGVWVLRNSWAEGWGENGYMYIRYGTSLVGYSANYVIYNSQSPTPTPTATPCVLVGDFNDDGAVDVVDIQQVASHWNCQFGDDCYDATYDVDTDDDIDVVDIMIVASHWGDTC